MGLSRKERRQIITKPQKFMKRIDSTNYVVSVYFSQTSKEKVEDKLLRLMIRDMDKIPITVPQMPMTVGKEKLK
jgi:hypothetical protein